MTISSTTRRAGPFAGNGVTIAFPFTFKVFATSDLVVTLTVVATGIESTLVLDDPAGYTVTLNPDQNANPGGTVNYNPSGTPMAATHELTLTSNVLELQTLDLTNGGGFFPSSISAALDRAVILIQQVSEKVNRSLTIPVSSTASTALPAPEASTFIGWNALGTALINYAGVASAAVSTFMATVLDDTTAAAARTTLGVDTLLGTLGDGATDNTAIIQAALTAGTTVKLGDGTFTTQKLTLLSNSIIEGNGPGKTILKLKDTTNDYLLYGSGSDALWGTNTDAGISNYQIRNLTLDGNLANNAAGLDGIAVYGQKPIIENVYIKNCKRYGMRTEWYQFGEAEFGMEGSFRHIIIDNIGQHGWLNKGPHDSVIDDVVIIDASQTTDNTYDGYRLENMGNARHRAVHVWNRSTATKFHRYAMAITGGQSEFTSCHAEGAKTANLYVSAVRQQFKNMQVYAPRGGKNVHFMAGAQMFSGYLGTKVAGSAAPVGITFGELGTTVGNCIIDAIVADQDAGIVDFTYSAGLNNITVRGTHNTGMPQYIGAPNAADKVEMATGGSGSFAIDTEQFWLAIVAAGTVQGDATALNQGYNTYQISTAAAGTGVRLWATVVGGEEAYVFNAGANAVNLYPATGDQINLLGTNNPLVIASGKGAYLRAVSANQWYAISGA